MMIKLINMLQESLHVQVLKFCFHSQCGFSGNITLVLSKCITLKHCPELKVGLINHTFTDVVYWLINNGLDVLRCLCLLILSLILGLVHFFCKFLCFCCIWWICFMNGCCFQTLKFLLFLIQ